MQVVIAASQFLHLSVTLNFLYVSGSNNPLLYYGSSHVFYFLYKFIRGDLRYFIKLDGFLSWVVSGIWRFVVKQIVDFTAIVHFRHPYDLGGIGFLLNKLHICILCFPAYYKYINTNTREFPLSDTVAACLIFIPLAINILSSVSFLFFIDRKYIHTFFTTMNGPEFAYLTFNEAETVEEKFDVFDNHRDYYRAFDGELKIWLNEIFDELQRDKPAWWTEDLIASIPNDLAPEALLQKFKKNGRKGSVNNIAAVIGRMSVKSTAAKDKNPSRVVPMEDDNVLNFGRVGGGGNEYGEEPIDPPFVDEELAITKERPGETAQPGPGYNEECSGAGEGGGDIVDEDGNQFPDLLNAGGRDIESGVEALPATT